MMKQKSAPVISVCVPTYNRTETVVQLIQSFKKQNYKRKELILCDDSTNDNLFFSIKNLIGGEIRYFRNNTNIGFSKNLRKSILKANGKYILVLGDDDVLLKPDTLGKYVHVFQTHKDVGFVYANQVQFSEKMKVEYEVTMFKRSKYYKSGKESMKHLWLSSIFIGGIGMRNDRMLISAVYPKTDILHPQCVLIAHILNSYASYAISDYLIAFRTRKDQFIFRALVDKKQRRQGQHQNIELLTIFNEVNLKYHLRMSDKFLIDRLIRNSLVLMPKEKMILGNRILTENYNKFVNESDRARKSLSLLLVYVASTITPRYIIFLFRAVVFQCISYMNDKKFAAYQQELLLMIHEGT